MSDSERKNVVQPTAWWAAVEEQNATKLAPLIVEYLRQRKNAAQAIETAIERSKDYREWRKSSG